MKTKEDLKNYLIEEADYSEETVESMDEMDLFKSYLEWNGIIGWEYDILDTVSAAFGVEIDY